MDIHVNQIIVLGDVTHRKQPLNQAIGYEKPTMWTAGRFKRELLGHVVMP